jgi:hypothetical protein
MATLKPTKTKKLMLKYVITLYSVDIYNWKTITTKVIDVTKL